MIITWFSTLKVLQKILSQLLLVQYFLGHAAFCGVTGGTSKLCSFECGKINYCFMSGIASTSMNENEVTDVECGESMSLEKNRGEGHSRG